MIGILMKRNYFHVGVEDVVISVAYFLLGQYYGWSMNRHCPIGEIVRYLEREVRQEVVDLLRRDAVSGGRYSHS